MEMLIHAHFFQWAILRCKVGQTDLVFGCDQGSLVGLCTLDYKSLCVVATICTTLVTSRQTDSILTSLLLL